MADEVRVNIVANGLKETIAGIGTIEQATKKRHDLKLDATAAKQLIDELGKDIQKAFSTGNYKLAGSLQRDLASMQQEARQLESQFKAVDTAIKLYEGSAKQSATATSQTAQAAQQVAREQAKVTEESKKSAAAAQDDWKARAEATKEAVRQAAETAKQREAAERAAAEAERAAKAEEEQRYAAYYASLEERNKAEAAKMAADEIARQEAAAQRTAQEEAAATAEAERMAAAAEAAEARFQAVLNTVEGIATALDVAASGVGLVNNFAEGIFDSFQFSSGLFNFDVLNKAMDTITSMITQNITGNMDRITARYDIMNTFDDYMRLMGVSEAKADDSISRINASILGLPIGLDEAMYRLRRYQMFMGDIDAATDFTIGLQRAIIAGGANEQMRNQAYNQIERLLSTGTLTTSRQWISLMTGLGVSSQFIAEQLGYEGWGGKELASALYQKEISPEEFLGAIAELGRGQSRAAERLNQALEIYKSTMESWQSNIEFAFVRGGEQTLETIDRMLTIETNVNLVGYMESFRDAVNNAFKEIRNWIDNNPKAFTLNIQAADKLLGSLGKFNLGNVASKGFEYVANFIESIANAIGGFDSSRVENFIAFATTVAGPIATLAQTAGPLGVAMGVAERFEGHDWGNFFGLVADNVNDIADAIAGVLGMFSDSTMDRILAFGVTYGPLLVTVLSKTAHAVRDVGKALEWLGEHQALSKLKSAIGYGNFDLSRSWLGISGGAWAAGTSILTAGTLVGGLAVAIHAINEYREGQAAYLEENADFLQAVEESAQRTQELHQNLLSIVDDRDESIGQATERADVVAGLLDKIEKLNAVVERTGNENVALELKTYVDLVNDMFPDMGLKIDEVTKSLDNHSKQILANRDAYIELFTVMAQYEAAQSALQGLYEQKVNLQFERIRNDNQIDATWEAYSKFLNDPYYDSVFSYFDAGWQGRMEEAKKAYDTALATGEQLTKDQKENEELIAAAIDLVLEYGKAAREVGNQTARAADKSVPAIGRYATALLDAVDAGEKVKTTTSTIAELADVTLPGATDKLETSAEALFAIADASDNAAESVASSSDAFAVAMEDLEAEAEDAETTVTKSLSSIGTVAMNALGIAAGEVSNLVEPIQRYTEELEHIIGSYADMKGAVIETFDSLMFGFGELSKIEPINLADTITGQQGNLENLAQLNTALDTILEYFYANRGQFSDYESSLWKMFLGDPTAHANEIVGLAQSIGTDSFNTVLSNMEAEDNVVLDVAQKATEAFSVLEQGIQNTSIAMKAVGDESQYAIDYFDEYIKERSDAIKGALRGDTLEGMLTDSGSEENVLDRLDEIRQKFYGEDEESVGGSAKLLNDLMITMYEKTYPDLEDGTNQLSNVMDDFTQNHLQQVINAYKDASDNADDLETETQEVGTEMTNQQETVSAFAGVVNTVADAAAAAAAAIGSMATAIAGINGASISIPTIPTVPSGAGSAVEMPFATGGEVGGVYKGYDSVHAILTPGEFVVRRKVAQALGKNFLQNLNSMNIPAAVESLMRGVNLPMNHGIVAYDNHRNYDNHATVNQYFDKSVNPAFTYRRASRFVGAL